MISVTDCHGNIRYHHYQLHGLPVDRLVDGDPLALVRQPQMEVISEKHISRIEVLKIKIILNTVLYQVRFKVRPTKSRAND